jgi:hypothetical protein
MMPALHPTYVCHCVVPNPKMHNGEDTGLCEACNCVYDENLYEMRLRQHTPNYTYADLDEFMRAADPEYAALS